MAYARRGIRIRYSSQTHAGYAHTTHSQAGRFSVEWRESRESQFSRARGRYTCVLPQVVRICKKPRTYLKKKEYA